MQNPQQLYFNNGNTFPPTLMIICIVITLGGLGGSFTPGFFVGIPVFFLGLCAITNRHIVHIQPENGIIHDHMLYLGFIKIGKKIPLKAYVYITAMPLIQSAAYYSRSSNSITISNNYHVLTIFGNRLRGKRMIRKFDTKTEATLHAKQLGEALNLTYFEYDPKRVRQMMLG